jgi:hypothetical protein
MGTQFVAGGFDDLSSEGRLATSPDGLNWTLQPGFASATQYRGIAWNGTTLVSVGVGVGGVFFIITSEDAVSWTEQVSPNPSGFLGAVIWTGTQFLAVGDYAATSPDGVIWADHNISPTFGTSYFSVTQNATDFVAAGLFSASSKSIDGGLTWTESLTDSVFLGNGVAFGDSKYVIVGSPAGDEGRIDTSANGAIWANTASFIDLAPQAIHYTGSKFISVGLRIVPPPPEPILLALGDVVSYSFDHGQTWEVANVPGDGQLFDAAWNGLFWCGVREGTSSSFTSTDGITWEEHPLALPSESWHRIAWNGNVFCAIKGFDGGTAAQKAATSPDGVTWTERTLSFIPPLVGWRDIAANGSVFTIITASQFTTTSSDDGVSWLIGTLPGPSNEDWIGLGSNGSVFTARSSQLSATSTDGIIWDAGPNPPVVGGPAEGVSLPWNGSVFVFVSQTGATAQTSPDGAVWTTRVLPFGGNLSCAAWDGTVFFVASIDGSGDGIYSFDGIAWVTIPATVPLDSGRRIRGHA